MYNPALMLELHRVRRAPRPAPKPQPREEIQKRAPRPVPRPYFPSVPAVAVERFEPRQRSMNTLSDYMDAASMGDATTTPATQAPAAGTTWWGGILNLIGSTAGSIAQIKSRELIAREQIKANIPTQPFFSNFTTPTGSLDFSTIAVVGAVGVGAYLLLKKR